MLFEIKITVLTLQYLVKKILGNQGCMFILRRVILAFYYSKKLQFSGLHNNNVPAGCFLAAILQIKTFQNTKFISELLKIYCNLFLRVLIQLSNSQKRTVRLPK